MGNTGPWNHLEEEMGGEEENGVLERMGREALIAVVRLAEEGISFVLRACEALSDGGVRIIEITADTPGAPEIIRRLRNVMGGEFLVGAGTVLDAHTARSMMEAGAEFVVSLATIEEVLAECLTAGVVPIPGVLSPTEVFRARKAGAGAVKIFPASVMGPGYLQQLSTSFPGVPLIPTGGINEHNIGRFLEAGALAVGMGEALVGGEAVRHRDWNGIASRASRLVELVRKAKGR